MKYFYDGHEKDSGIYKILNTHTGRVYIGQAKQFDDRWPRHRRDLYKKKKKTPILQNDFNKCLKELGHDDFLEFYVLEVLPGTTRLQRNPFEEKWISIFDIPDKIYNIEKHPASGDPSCFSHTPEETKVKLSIAVKKMWENKDIRIKITELSKQRWQNPKYRESRTKQIQEYSSKPETKEKRSKVAKERYNDPVIGETIKTTLADARLKQLGTKAAIEINAKTFSGFILTSPTGEKYQNIKNLAQFARDHQLNESGLRAFIYCKRESYNGWRLVPVESSDNIS